MKATLLEAALNLVDRAADAGKRGAVFSGDEFLRLRDDLSLPLPEWLCDLFTIVPLCGVELGWQAFAAEPGYDGIVWLEWSTPAGIRSESIDCYPGLAVRSHGYVNVASDSTGGGDPYFVNIYEGDDPPLYQIYHDVSDRGEVIIAQGRRLVAPRLSEFFAAAKVIA